MYKNIKLDVTLIIKKYKLHCNITKRCTAVETWYNEQQK